MRIRAAIVLFTGLLFTLSLFLTPARAATVAYDLTIARQKVDITGKAVPGMTINGTIPGPTLRFREGDTARIRVHNKMSVSTSIHWHGILVPPGMDGVPYVSFPPIAAGTTFTYEFPIRQRGTYWYHSHTSLQEQSGVYGAIVIQPRRKTAKFDQDQVVLFSDWTNEDPYEVNRTLRRGSEWYALEKGSRQSILGAARLGMLGDYFKRELQRMPPMDIADVAYDRFLANGRPQLMLSAKAGERLRLRLVDGSATTYFYVEFAGGPMTIISADGQDVKPVAAKRFLISVAETYDVSIRVPAGGAYELRATAHDGSGYASVWIGSGKRHPAPDVPRPNLYHTMGKLSFARVFAATPAGSMGMSDARVQAGDFDKPGMAGMKMGGMPGMRKMARSHAGAKMKMKPAFPEGRAGKAGGMSMPPPSGSGEAGHGSPARPMPDPNARSGKKYAADFGWLAADVASSGDLAADGVDARRPWAPYARLRAVKPTGFAAGKPMRIIRLTLDGDMERYVWFLNNRALSESDMIRIRRGEIVRFIMINRTMMHHPMHLHGHFFRVINGQGAYAPLKHTVDVAPMSTTVIEFKADEFGDWFFHCHLLYHMKNGMARVVHYEGFGLDPKLAAVRPALYRDTWYFSGQADALSNMTEGFLALADIRNILTAEWEVGWQEVDGTEWETLFSWNRYINRFFTVFGGADLLGVDGDTEDSRGVFGIRYLLPLNLESRAWIDTDGGARFILAKSLELTPRLALFGDAQYDTHDRWESRVGLSYMVHKNFTLIGQWHSDYGFGGGLRILF